MPRITTPNAFAYITPGFADLYSNLGPLDEGLVFKFMRGKLAPCVKETSNTDWQSKCRIPQRNYSF